MLVIKAFIRPFFVTFLIVMFVLLMLFLFKYIDDLIGKGFEWYVILELMWYASATNVAMALPLAMLLSSIMTFGSLGENYELVAIKAAGISLQKAMMPLVVLISMLSIAAFLFSDYMLPVANLKMGSLLWDVRNQKSTKLIQEGVFNSTFDNYAIKVEKKDPDGQTLHNVLIYENNGANGASSVIKAKSGKMYKTHDDQFLVMILKDGVRYEETSGDKVYNPRQRFSRFFFQQTEQKFNISSFKMKRTDEDLFKNNAAMLNLKQLKYYQDSTGKIADSNASAIYRTLLPSYRVFFSNYRIAQHPKIKAANKPVLEIIPETNRSQSIEYAMSQARTLSESLTMRKEEQEGYYKLIRRYIVEYHRKFTLALSCLVLFFIGAPLGAIIRKGGLGLPVVVSIIFFLIFHIISTIGEKAAREGSITPLLGMWIAIVVLAPLGAFLTYKAASDSVLFDLDYYKQYFQKLFKRFKKST
nr:LptF/LptG family permease [Pedobacter sp. SYSU D00823]